ncbi:hypothetical protein NDN08_006594 [Rhodosorus marinus]|uniref:Cation/H+ exchanger transmembrane domain-containing protein n=1 Tax=Rhodosorus marinus TaxID=101924 RepID=A0AAV8UNE3_9RHOD|nr:hypothetical protein NDN08_006594 [Rhodosorus marinus]
MEHADGTDIFSSIMYLLSGTVLIRVVNYHYIKLAPSVVTALSAVVWGGALMLLQAVNSDIASSLGALRNILRNFPELVMDYMLGFLLFAAAIEVDLGRLGRVRSTVITLALGGTVLSTLFVGTLTWLLLRRIVPLPFAICLLFGTVVSPTDPVAVTSILNEKPDLISESTRYFVWCESLFNDAVGVVLYYGMLNFTVHGDAPVSDRLWAVVEVFLRECVVGVVLGLVMGYMAYLLIQAVSEPVLEITITIVLVGMLEVVCLELGASIPLATICAGLLIGNYGLEFGFSPEGAEGFHQLWRFIDETLNSVLFLMIGLMSIYWQPDILGWGKYFIMMLAIIPISLFSRAMSITLSLSMLLWAEKLLGRRLRHPSVRYRAGTIGVLTWGGLRGGLTIALALGAIRTMSPISSASGNIFFLMTYTIVVWSLVGQGLTFETACRLIQDGSYYYKSAGDTTNGIARAFFDADGSVTGETGTTMNTSRSAHLIRGLTQGTILYSEESSFSSAGGKDGEGEGDISHQRYSSMAGLGELQPLPGINQIFKGVSTKLFNRGSMDLVDEEEEEEYEDDAVDIVKKN